MPDWLIEELKSKYGVQKDVGKQWLQEKHLLPLLDGLDEVKPDHQEACIQAINQWLQSDSRPISAVVCSRREEYVSYQTQLHLNGAILLQALTDEQIQDYLTTVNRTELWQMLQQDAVLLELMKTPLLLSITVLSYGALSLQQWHQLTSTKERLNLLLDTYIQTMLSREFQSRYYCKCKPPATVQTCHWLTFLAQQLQRESQIEFLIEGMQPSWLIENKQKIYELVIGLCITVLFGLFFGLYYLSNFSIADLVNEPVSFSEQLLWLAALFVSGGLFNGVLSWLSLRVIFGKSKKIILVETFNSSIKQAKKGIRDGLTLGMFFGLIGGLIGQMDNDLIHKLTGGLIGGLIGGIATGLIFGLLGGVIGGLTGSEMDIKRNPNQGIRRSANNALFVMLIGGLISVLCIFALNFSTLELFFQQVGNGKLSFQLLRVASGNLIIGLGNGLSIGMIFGGLACVQHFALRLILYQNRSIPWNYARFLNYCTERLLLQRVGGRYRFVHKLLQERFAEIDGRWGETERRSGVVGGEQIWERSDSSNFPTIQQKGWMRSVRVSG